VSQATILVVDDEPLNLAVLSRLLSPTYRVLGARSGSIAMELMRSELPDLILLDVVMPGVDGHAILSQLHTDPRTSSVPVIFVTALGAETDEEQGLRLGAVDYLIKPLKPAIVLARVRTHLELKLARDRLSQQNAWLERELERRMRDYRIVQDLTLCAMAELVETRDTETGNHILRTQTFVEMLGRELQQRALYSVDLAETQLQRIVKAAPMHDIGKIGIRDQILLKPGKLDSDQYAVMKTHARIGGEAIEHAIQRVLAMHPPVQDDMATPESVRFLEVARLIATHHHERWDGTGYPDGLSGAEIPLPARLMSLADVYDALTSDRVYKPAWDCDDAAGWIIDHAGSQFDPGIVDAFQAISGRFAEVAHQLAD
jgi:putative two-component system response regulator